MKCHLNYLHFAHAEESLQEIKEAVRRKLGLSLDSIIKLEQLREGNLIDLEDGMAIA